MGIVNDLARLGPAVKRAVVKGRAEPGSELEGIDLLQDSLSASAQVVPGRGQRIARQERWAALFQQMMEWRGAGLLPVER
jgi:hypothetical protein